MDTVYVMLALGVICLFAALLWASKTIRDQNRRIASLERDLLFKTAKVEDMKGALAFYRRQGRREVYGVGKQGKTPRTTA